MAKSESEMIVPDEIVMSKVVAKCDHLKTLKYSPVLPSVFTEYGAVMLASVLNSYRAIEVNIQIVRIFTQMREMLITNQEILLKPEQLERRVSGHDVDTHRKAPDPDRVPQIG